VRLTATNAGGSDDEPKLGYVTVTAAPSKPGVSSEMLLRRML
jgi:PKD repeat protein